MDIRLFQRFIAVAECGGVNKAASKLNLSQPALTKSIRLLEERLDVALMVRGPRGISITPMGEKILKYAKLMEAEVRKLDGEISACKNISMGKVRVGVPPGPGFLSTVLPTAAKRFTRSDLRVTLDVTMGIRADLLRMLQHGEIDFMISTAADEAASELTHERLYEDRLVIVASAEHPLASDSVVPTAALSNYPWVIQKQASAVSDAVLDEVIEANTRRSTISSNSTQFVKIMIADHQWIGVAAYDAVRIEIQKGSMKELNVEDPWVKRLLQRRVVEISYRRDVPLSSSASKLKRYIKAACAVQYPPVSQPPKRKTGASRTPVEA